MFKIKNKKESAKLIEKLRLNKLQDIYLENFDEQKIKDFVNKNPYDFYAVRSRTVAASKIFNLKVKKEGLIDYTKDLKDFSINVSSYSFFKHQLLTGEIQIDKNMTVSLTASSNPMFSARDGAQIPDYSVQTNIYDKSLYKIKGFKYLIDYIFENELFNVIVEFAVFDINVGINNQKVVVFELRTDY